MNYAYNQISAATHQWTILMIQIVSHKYANNVILTVVHNPCFTTQCEMLSTSHKCNIYLLSNLVLVDEEFFLVLNR